MNRGMVILLVGLAAMAYWFNWSPPAQNCFARGGTTFDLDGSCLKVEVTKR